MTTLLLYLIAGVALATLLVLGALVMRAAGKAAYKWVFGENEDNPRI